MTDESLRVRAERLLPEGEDLILVILKGHLLIEEQLELVLEHLSRSPGELQDARLTFAQRFRLVRALTGNPGTEVCRFIKNLNSLRNQLMHQAEHPNLTEAIDRLLEGDFLHGDASDAERAAWLRMNIGIALGFLYSLASHVQPVGVAGR